MSQHSAADRAALRHLIAPPAGGDCGGHSHARASNQRRLGWMLALVLAYMLAEVVGGLMSGSLALLADAGHMLSDAAALALSFFAIWVARRPPTPRNTYGFHRSEILAALLNSATLVAVSVWILVEALERFGSPTESTHT